MMFLGLRDRPLVHISMPMQVIITIPTYALLHIFGSWIDLTFD